MDRQVQLPPEPRQPDDSECCGQGCQFCVHDVYKQEVLIWKKKCHEIQNRNFEQSTRMSVDTYVDCVIESVEQMCSSVFLFKFNLPEDCCMNFSACQHAVVRENADGRTVSRPYTIISSPGLVNSFSVMIKLYSEGKMSKIIREKWIQGYSVAWRGPVGVCHYKPNSHPKVLLIAAGTGIAPLYQLLKLIVDNQDDETRVTLFYGCRNYEEILLRPQLHEMQDFWNIKIRYFLSDDIEQRANAVRKHNEDIVYHKINADSVEKEVNVTNSPRVYLCGPKAFEIHFVEKLTEFGVDKSSIVTFG